MEIVLIILVDTVDTRNHDLSNSTHEKPMVVSGLLVRCNLSDKTTPATISLFHTIIVCSVTIKPKRTAEVSSFEEDCTCRRNGRAFSVMRCTKSILSCVDRQD